MLFRQQWPQTLKFMCLDCTICYCASPILTFLVDLDPRSPYVHAVQPRCRIIGYASEVHGNTLYDIHTMTKIIQAFTLQNVYLPLGNACQCPLQAELSEKNYSADKRVQKPKRLYWENRGLEAV